MCRIKVKNFGPIHDGMGDDAWLDINKVTIFIGSQGSGKSTLAKLISTFFWMEKVLMRGDHSAKYFTDYQRFKKRCCAYHRIEDFFREDTHIEYYGKSYHFTYQDAKLNIKRISNDKEDKHGLAQVLYIPSERNFISNVKNFKGFKSLSPAFASFIDDFQLVKDSIKESVGLPINSTSVEYDRLNDIFHIKGEDYKVRLTAASSGFQSLTPLFLSSRHFASKVYNASHQQLEMSSEDRSKFKKAVDRIWRDKDMSEEQKSDAISVIAKGFTTSSFINIVEEPEQNLYPSSQREILYSLLELNNQLESNKLIITTHSPYIINYLTLAALAHQVTPEKHDKLKEIISPLSTINGESVSVYVCNDKDGSIHLIPPYEGCPSSEHALNTLLGESNDTFSEILNLI